MFFSASSANLLVMRIQLLSMVLLCSSISLYGQASAITVPSAPSASRQASATALVSASLSALIGNAQLTDATLTGTAVAFAGNKQQSAKVRIQFKGSGASRVDLDFGASQRTEIQESVSEGMPQAVAISDGISKTVVPHNCWTPSNWFSPISVLSSGLSPSGSLTYLGTETNHGISVDHLRAVLSRGAPSAPPKLSAIVERLSTVDIYLDKVSHLPWSIAYNTHPDDDLKVDIPVEVLFADYRAAQGVVAPYRIQRIVGGNLDVDITVSTIAINGGVSDTVFTF